MPASFFCLVALSLAPAAPAAAVEALPDLEQLVPGLPGVEQVEQGDSSIIGAIGVEPAMVAEVNRVRARRGLPAMRYSASLRRSARGYALWMLRNDYFGHLSQIRASRRYRRLGEAIALHSGRRPRVRSTVEHWLRSPRHRRLLLSHSLRHVGGGHATGSYRGRIVTDWVLHLGG